MLDTGQGNIYASESLIDLFKVNPVRKEHKTIEKLTNSTTKKYKIDNVKVESSNQTFSYQTEFSKLEREEVLTILANLQYTELTGIQEHLRGIKMRDIKLELLIFVILAASDYLKIKLQKKRVGKINGSVAKQT